AGGGPGHPAGARGQRRSAAPPARVSRPADRAQPPRRPADEMGGEGGDLLNVPSESSGALRGASGESSGALRGASGESSGALRGASGESSGALSGASGGRRWFWLGLPARQPLMATSVWGFIRDAALTSPFNHA